MRQENPEKVVKNKANTSQQNTGRYAYYVYRWDRIIGVFVVLLALIGMAAYGIHSLFQPGETGLTETAREIPRKAPNEEKALADDSKDTIETMPVASGVIQPQALPRTPELHIPAPKAASSDQPAADSAAVALQAPVAVSAEEIPISTGPEENARSRSSQEDLNKPEVAEPGVKAGPFSLKNINLLSPVVKRFVLAKSVVNKKPIGEIHEIRPDARGAAAVYAFSDVVGMRGTVVDYHWILNGKRVAKVRVKVGANRWRSHSSKVISERMQGSWRVELRDAQNQLFASAEFVY
jgi:hypothetical protein